MVESTKTDRRREAGEQTRQRLLDATRALLAERGEDGITLRDITGAADANVAAVSYHFGSLAALIRAAIEQAIEALMESRIERIRALGDDPTLEQIAASMAQPVIAAMRDTGCAEQAFLQIMARVLTDPPPDLEDWIRAKKDRVDAEMLALLRSAVPGVSDDELDFRVQSTRAILNFLVSGGVRVDLRGKGADELERMLVSVITGTLAGGAPPGGRAAPSDLSTTRRMSEQTCPKRL
jgi:AcrR family transcriptional regulator